MQKCCVKPYKDKLFFKFQILWIKNTKVKTIYNTSTSIVQTLNFNWNGVWNYSKIKQFCKCEGAPHTVTYKLTNFETGNIYQESSSTFKRVAALLLALGSRLCRRVALLVQSSDSEWRLELEPDSAGVLSPLFWSSLRKARTRVRTMNQK